ncbi:MAG: hypothetical protein AAFV87_06965 [Pseudomonadota bacterium]
MSLPHLSEMDLPTPFCACSDSDGVRRHYQCRKVNEWWVSLAGNAQMKAGLKKLIEALDANHREHFHEWLYSTVQNKERLTETSMETFLGFIWDPAWVGPLRRTAAWIVLGDYAPAAHAKGFSTEHPAQNS